MRTFIHRPRKFQSVTRAPTGSRAALAQDHDVMSPTRIGCAIGNQAAQRLWRGEAEGGSAALAGLPARPFEHWALQAKLLASQAGDEYEREADQIAEQVVHMPDRPQERGRVGGVGGASEVPGLYGKHVQAKKALTGDAGQAAAPGGHHQISSATGHPLDSNTQGFMESSFGCDFSHVRVHTDTSAIQLNDTLSAQAFTYGPNIYFNRGEYSPASADGKKLLAHELAHVVQQSNIENPQPEQGQTDSKPASTAAPGSDGVSGALPKLHSHNPRVQRQASGTSAQVPPMRRGTESSSRCEMQSGVFFWHIVPGARDRYVYHDPSDPPGVMRERLGGGCFNVQIVFLPGRTEILRAGGAIALGARWLSDMRPIALVQTVAEGSTSGAFEARVEMDVSPNDAEPFYGAQFNRSTGTWQDEPHAIQGCSSLPNADTGVGRGPGSSFSRPGSFGAVINDSPMLTPNMRKVFETAAVVMGTGESLASMAWSIEHDGREAKVNFVRCREAPSRVFEERLGRYYGRE